MGLTLPVLTLTSAFSSQKVGQEPIHLSYVKPTKKDNFEFLQTPFKTVSLKLNKPTKHRKHVNRKVKQQTVEQQAGEIIAQAESGGSYTARNGRYYGKYQLDISYLHGDLSPANQERVFIQYCDQRYGSIENALIFRETHNWY